MNPKLINLIGAIFSALLIVAGVAFMVFGSPATKDSGFFLIIIGVVLSGGIGFNARKQASDDKATPGEQPEVPQQAPHP